MIETTRKPTVPSLLQLCELVQKYHQPFQSNFQNDCFVLSQEGVTWWGAFRQCLREVAARVEAMRVEYIELNEAIAVAAEKTSIANGTKEQEKGVHSAVKNARKRYEASKSLLQKASLQMRMQDREREASHLINRLFALWDKCVETYGADLNPEELDEMTWARKLHRRALAEKVCHGQVSAGVLESILALPVVAMAEIIGDCGRLQGAQCIEILKSMPLPDVAGLSTPMRIKAHQVRPLLSGERFEITVEDFSERFDIDE